MESIIRILEESIGRALKKTIEIMLHFIFTVIHLGIGVL